MIPDENATADEILPWTVTDGPALEPGVPGDIPEEMVESVQEIRRGEIPWHSEGSVSLRNENGTILLTLATLLVLWYVLAKTD